MPLARLSLTINDFTMMDCLRLLAMMFYAPTRGMREARDHGTIGAMVVCSYVIQVIYNFLIQLLAGDRTVLTAGPGVIVSVLFHAAGPILTVAIVFVPVLTLIANLFDRRGSFSVVLQQEYASLASSVFYVLTGASLIALLVAAIFHFTGVQATYIVRSQDPAQIQAVADLSRVPFEQVKAELSPEMISKALFEMARFAFFAIGGLMIIREIFRLSALKTLAILVLTSMASFPLTLILYPVFSRVVGSPFLLLFAFFLLRGYFTELVGSQRARAAFKQNLEAATINPRDSSAHYNLGLIHQQRGELDLARERFQRAIDIDPEELDAHYQLGRIARTQNRLAEAIGHFEQVVQRDESHALHEIWREIGATYLAAGQFGDARDVLEKFLERRANDPQGLYLIGRAHAGLGDNREAASSMQACIEAVKSAPAYKYRTEKRWLNEAQQFMKTSRQQAASK